MAVPSDYWTAGFFEKSTPISIGVKATHTGSKDLFLFLKPSEKMKLFTHLLYSNFVKYPYLEIKNRLRLSNLPKGKPQALALVFALLLINSFSGFAQVSEDWAARYNGPANNEEGQPKMAVDPEGNVYVTGPSEGIGTGYDYATIKFSAAGGQQWVARYNGPADGDDYPFSIGLDAEGNVYVTGFSEGAGTGNDYATVKYNSMGEQQWVSRYNGPENGKDYALSMAVDAEGNSYVTGASEGSGSGEDYATLKYNSSGEEQWVNRYDGPGNSQDDARSIAIDADGNVYVTGSSINYDGSGTGSDYATLKYSATGREEWVARYHMGEQAHAVIVDAEGNVYVTGLSTETGPTGDYGTVKYNASGEQQWAARYNGSDNLFDIATSLATDPEGNVYVTGSVNNASGRAGDYATVKYNASGEQQWAQEYSGPDNYTHQFPSLVADAEGNVYVSGGSGGIGSRYDFATLKYNTLGELQWEERYNGPANGDDSGSAVAIDAEGNIYVAGRSWGAQLHYDFAIVKYSQEINNAPVATDDAYETDEGVELTAEAPGVLANDQGDELTATLVTEPANGAVTLNADGSFSYTPAPCFHGSDSFTYTAGDGTQTSGEATVTISVNPTDNGPEITSVSRVDPQQVNTGFSMSASVTANTPATARFDWGDGSGSEEIMEGSVVTGYHMYTRPGFYTVTISVTDACGETDSMEYEHVVVYDPDAGFMAGGGWFYSPAGAYAADPAAEGKVNFAFQGIYKKKAQKPLGSLVFSFKAGKLSFISTAFEWLVITADQAFLKGTGTINGNGHYSFWLSVVDAPGNGSTDRIRMQIWDSNGALVYDNQMGAARNAEASMPIGGGAVVIHKGKKISKYNVGTKKPVTLHDRISESFRVYPVPLDDQGLWLEFPVLENGIFQVSVYDLRGRKMAEKQFDSGSEGYKQLWKPGNQNWPSGIYVLTISGEGFLHQQKITK